MNIQELDVTSEQLRDLAHAMGELGVNVTYNDDLREVAMVVNDKVTTFVQTAAAESEEIENAYWHMDAEAVAKEVAR